MVSYRIHRNTISQCLNYRSLRSCRRTLRTTEGFISWEWTSVLFKTVFILNIVHYGIQYVLYNVNASSLSLVSQPVFLLFYSFIPLGPNSQEGDYFIWTTCTLPGDWLVGNAVFGIPCLLIHLWFLQGHVRVTDLTPVKVRPRERFHASREVMARLWHPRSLFYALEQCLSATGHQHSQTFVRRQIHSV